MANIPSSFRSQKLAAICEKHRLTDPFRALFPNRRDFSYVPRTGRNNRSRLDFFITRENLIQNISSVHISEGLATKLFDHKSVTLKINETNFHTRKTVSNMILDHPRFDEILITVVHNTSISHEDIAQFQGHEDDLDNWWATVSRLLFNQRLQWHKKQNPTRTE